MGDKLFDEWRVYQKLLDHDYMDHRAFFSRLEREARARFDVLLIEGDLLDELDRVDGPFDLAVASFSLHHLPTPSDKGDVLGRCRERLAPDGLLAVIDVFREPGEARAAYLERWIDFARTHYHALETGEKAMLFEHVRGLDTRKVPIARPQAAPVKTQARVINQATGR